MKLHTFGNVSITYCAYQNNSATSGGALMLEAFNTVMYVGPQGVLDIFGRSHVNITNCTFIKNTADYGAALYVIKDLIIATSFFPLLLQDVVIKDNHCFGGGAIYFDGVRLDIFGNTPTGSQFSSNSAQGAIQGQNGLLLLHGNITFTENRGGNGGAISLYNDVPLYFYSGCRVEFTRNTATGFGGAIYNDWGQKGTNHLLCIIRFSIIRSLSITFTDNHAQLGGHAVYATPIHKLFFKLHWL